MAAVTPSSSEWARPMPMLRDVLREELAPYPGRGILAARMVVAATLMMLVDLTFGLPDAAYNFRHSRTARG